MNWAQIHTGDPGPDGMANVGSAGIRAPLTMSDRLGPLANVNEMRFVVTRADIAAAQRRAPHQSRWKKWFSGDPLSRVRAPGPVYSHITLWDQYEGGHMVGDVGWIQAPSGACQADWFIIRPGDFVFTLDRSRA